MTCLPRISTSTNGPFEGDRVANSKFLLPQYRPYAVYLGRTAAMKAGRLRTSPHANMRGGSGTSSQFQSLQHTLHTIQVCKRCSKAGLLRSRVPCREFGSYSSHRRALPRVLPEASASSTQGMISDAEKFIQSITTDDLANANPSSQLESQLQSLEQQVCAPVRHLHVECRSAARG